MKNKLYYFVAGLLAAAAALTLAGPMQDARHTSVVEVVKRTSPSVVNISTEGPVSSEVNPFARYSTDPTFNEFFRDFFDPRYGRNQVRQSLGSGVLIDSQGHVLTNEHVVINSGRIVVTLVDGKAFEAEIIGADTESDLAVLKLAGASRTPFLAMGDSDEVMVGEPSIAIGNPFGLGHTVTTGVISATRRSIQTPERVYLDFIQTDASINPGNSGGPLLNANGELIGINSAIYNKAQGIGFALPINRARQVVNDLIRYGEVQVGWLGLQVRDLTEDMARSMGYRGPGGVVVSLIVDKGPAENSNLRYGDIIEEMNGSAVRGKDDFKAIARTLPMNKTVELKVDRKGSPVVVHITTSEFPIQMAEDVARYMLGIQVGPAPRNIAGVVIQRVAPGSPSAEKGLRKGDLILKLNRDRITNMTDWRRAAAKMRIMDSALLLVQRGRSVYYVTVPLGM